MFAITQFGGKQYKVAPKDIIEVEKLQGEAGDTVTSDHVLLISDGKTVTVGKPFIKDAKVTARIISQEKGEKITVRRFKSKVRYRKARGFRAHITKIEITAIS